MEIEVGQTYDVYHPTKGSFTIIVTAAQGDVVAGTITEGVAFFGAEPDRTPGDLISLAKHLCTFTLAITQ